MALFSRDNITKHNIVFICQTEKATTGAAVTLSNIKRLTTSMLLVFGCLYVDSSIKICPLPGNESTFKV